MSCNHGPGGVCHKMHDALDRHVEAHWHLHQLNAHYHQADPFRYSLNSFLRVLKEVPQIVLMELQREPKFKAFFDPLRRALLEDPLFQSVSKKRDHIVHRGMLLPQSSVVVGASRLGAGKFKLGLPFPASPSEDSDEVMLRFVAACARDEGLRRIFLPHPDQVACVHRVWRLTDHPEVEIRELAARAWKRVGSLISDVLVWLGHDPVSFEVPCMAEHLSVDTTFRYYPREIFGLEEPPAGETE